MNRSTKLTYGLERDYFVGDEIYLQETEKVFSQNWLCVGRVEDFASANDSSETVVRRKIGDYDLIVIRRGVSSFSAFHNICRHRGTRLVDADETSLKNSCLTCPYHAWTYDLDGKLIGAPNMNEVEGFNRDDHGLMTVACVNWCGFVMVHLNRTNEDFETDFAPIIQRTAPWEMEKLNLQDTLEYTVQANWKLVFQNYSECYHCPTVHPNLNRLTPYRGATNDLLEGPILGGPMGLSSDTETVSLDGKKIAECLSGLDDEQKRCVYYYTLFPSMFVSAHPDYVMVHALERVSNSQTKVICYFLTANGTKKADLDRATKQWDEVNLQDWHVCELTQKGIESPAYRPGPYSNLEPMLIAFDRYYRSVI
jgi:Rieske 2Fe-2S family protein